MGSWWNSGTSGCKRGMSTRIWRRQVASAVTPHTACARCAAPAAAAHLSEHLLLRVAASLRRQVVYPRDERPVLESLPLQDDRAALAIRWQIPLAHGQAVTRPRARRRPRRGDAHQHQLPTKRPELRRDASPAQRLQRVCSEARAPRVSVEPPTSAARGQRPPAGHAHAHRCQRRAAAESAEICRSAAGCGRTRPATARNPRGKDRASWRIGNPRRPRPRPRQPHAAGRCPVARQLRRPGRTPSRCHALVQGGPEGLRSGYR